MDLAHLADIYWEYYRLAFSDDRYDRLDSERLVEEANQVTVAAWENTPGIVPLLVALAEAAPDEDALGYLGAGPIEDLLCRHARDVVDQIDEQARQSEKFRYALRCAWFDDKVPDRIAK